MAEGSWVVGFHAVLAVLEGSEPVDAVWLQKDRRDERTRQISRATHRRGLRFDLVPRARLDGVSEGVAHNGCAVRTSPVQFVSLDDVTRAPDEPGRILVLDSLEDPHNLGAVLRTAAAFDLDGVVIAGPSAPPLGGAVAKGAAGQLGKVPLVRSKVAADVLATLRSLDYWVVAAEAGGRPLGEVRFDQRCALCIGAEARGLRAKTRSQVDEFISIPMAEGVESLNLSVAAGILLWELSKT
jgi:23S rRNA (guanosine2251-2'-O)-methyltransferase